MPGRNRPLGEIRYLLLDARYEKVREGGVVRDAAVLSVIGIGPDQRRRVLGVSCALSEAEVHWRAFLETLVARGMRGVAYIVSDDHPGLGAARKPSSAAPSGSAVSTIWLKTPSITPPTSPSERPRQGAAPGLERRRRQGAEAELGHLVAAYRDSAPKLADWLETAIPEGLAVALPERHQKRMRTSNPMERSIQQEIKRRTVKVRVFPNEARLNVWSPPSSSKSTRNGKPPKNPTSLGKQRMTDQRRSEFPHIRLLNPENGGGLNGSTQHFILNEEMECMQMTRRNGRGFSSAEKTELWDRWQRGESLKAIGRVFGKPSSSIYFQLSPHGGIRPSPRRRSRLALSLWEREEISRGIVARHSIRSMALLLSRSPSTVSREVRRNGGYDQYRAALADDMAWARARRPKRCKLALSSGMRRVVAMKLGLNWSPEQIAGWLKRAHPGAGSYQVSHETIYRSLFVQARGVLKKELLQHLRSKRTIRRSKEARRKGVGRGQITDMVSIRERPASVEDRAVPGHWEGDLLSGSKNSYIATLVERQTRYVMLVKVANKETLTVVSALIRQARKLPTELYKSLTWDRGKELADHRRFSLATDIDVYFCDPQSPWQRGSNENTNGLLRQYFPKGTDVSVYSQAHLNKVARQLNERPRKTLGFETPAERFNACVASTG